MFKYLKTYVILNKYRYKLYQKLDEKNAPINKFCACPVDNVCTRRESDNIANLMFMIFDDCRFVEGLNNKAQV